jgi:predicted membrane-bound spermidine synthase
MLSNITEMSPQQSEDLKQLAESLNDQLRSSSSSGAEKAFGLGCGLGLLPVLGVVLMLWVTGVLSLIPALFLSAIGLIALVGVSLLLAQVARQRAAQRIFSTEIEPEIITFSSEQQIDRRVFDYIASRSLPADAPLQVFLSPENLDAGQHVSESS